MAEAPTAPSAQQRKLDPRSQELLDKALAVPEQERTPARSLFYDVAIGFKEGQPMMYRLIWIYFPERKLMFLRHNKVREEFGLYAIINVTKFELNKIKLVIGNYTILIQPQSIDDYHAIYKLFRTITLNHNLPITTEEYALDVCFRRAA